MRIHTLTSLLAMGLAAACGASADAVEDDPRAARLDVAPEGEDMKPAAGEEEDLDTDTVFYLDSDTDPPPEPDEVHPADVLEPRSDLRSLPDQAEGEPRTEPPALPAADVGDPRLQVDTVGEEVEAKPGEQPADHP